LHHQLHNRTLHDLCVATKSDVPDPAWGYCSEICRVSIQASRHTGEARVNTGRSVAGSLKINARRTRAAGSDFVRALMPGKRTGNERDLPLNEAWQLKAD